MNHLIKAGDAGERAGKPKVFTSSYIRRSLTSVQMGTRGSRRAWPWETTRLTVVLGSRGRWKTQLPSPYSTGWSYVYSYCWKYKQAWGSMMEMYIDCVFLRTWLERVDSGSRLPSKILTYSSSNSRWRKWSLFIDYTLFYLSRRKESNKYESKWFTVMYRSQHTYWLKKIII
jgi:hypothetical protein